MDIFLHRHRPQHISPLQANSRTRSHAQLGLATFTFHFSTISSRDESIRAAQCNRWVEWVISASRTGVFTSNHSLHFKLIHILMGHVNGTDLPPMMVSYLLWGREAAPHWLGWMSTSWRTPPPLPRHSRSRSTGREEGHKPRRKGAERGAVHLLTDVKCDNVAKEERERLAEVWYCTESSMFSSSVSSRPPGGTGVHHL